MPIYGYQCAACGFEKDVLQKISDAPLTTCPSCGQAQFSRQVSAPNFQLKGTGWYVTDFRDGNKNGGGKKGDKKSEPGDGGSGDASAGKSDGGDPSGQSADKSAGSQSDSNKPAPAPAPAPAASGTGSSASNNAT